MQKSTTKVPINGILKHVKIITKKLGERAQKMKKTDDVNKKHIMKTVSLNQNTCVTMLHINNEFVYSQGRGYQYGF